MFLTGQEPKSQHSKSKDEKDKDDKDDKDAKPAAGQNLGLWIKIIVFERMDLLIISKTSYFEGWIVPPFLDEYSKWLEIEIAGDLNRELLW